MACRHIKVAVIEPDDEIAQLYETYLTRQGFTVQRTLWLEGVSPDAKIVIAEPDECSTLSFCQLFKEIFPDKELIVASKRGDILSGTRYHSHTLAITKPFHLSELAEAMEVIIEPTQLRTLQERS
jgi:DNA-binding response OmpR family regulator